MLPLPSIRMVLRLGTESNSKNVNDELEVDCVQLAFDAYVGSGTYEASIAYRLPVAIRAKQANATLFQPLNAAYMALTLLILIAMVGMVLHRSNKPSLTGAATSLKE